MKTAPIVLFAFARPDHTLRTLNALASNELASDSKLYVFCDGARNEKDVPMVEKTWEVLESITGFQDVVIKKAPSNQGLARSIRTGISSILESHDRTIVVEDDLVSAPNFLAYMNEGLERYKAEQRVFAICGYAPPLKGIPADYAFDAFFSCRPMAWGWGTWPDRWAKADFEVRDFDQFRKDKKAQRRFSLGGADAMRLLFDQMEGRANTWDIQWHYSVFKHDGLALLPVHSLIQNIGTDATGTHFTGATDRYDVDLANARPITKWPDRIELDERMAKSFRRCYARTFERGVKKALHIVKGAISPNRT